MDKMKAPAIGPRILAGRSIAMTTFCAIGAGTIAAIAGCSGSPSGSGIAGQGGTGATGGSGIAGQGGTGATGGSGMVGQGGSGATGGSSVVGQGGSGATSGSGMVGQGGSGTTGGSGDAAQDGGGSEEGGSGTASGSSGVAGSGASGSAGASPDSGAAPDAAALGGGDSGTVGSSGSFVLSWEDNFDALNLSQWQLETFTYGGNKAEFSTQNAAVANGILTISLTPNPSNVAEPYNGVEMRSAKTLMYGKVSASMRFAHGSGVVSGLVLFYTKFPNCNWNEIDIEHLGDSSNTSQLNCQVFKGTVNPTCTTSVTATQDPLIVNLGVNAETAFHQYDIEWTPAGVTTRIDGTMLRTWTKSIALMNLPQTVLLTIWASSSASWAGALAADSAPTGADIDWIKVYSWQP